MSELFEDLDQQRAAGEERDAETLVRMILNTLELSEFPADPPDKFADRVLELACGALVAAVGEMTTLTAAVLILPSVLISRRKSPPPAS